jgi:hypothetical protein
MAQNYPNLTNLLSGQSPVGIKKVYIKNGSESWQTMGNIRNGELKITPNKTNDTYQRNLPITTYKFEAKFEMLQTSVTALELIPNIVNGVAGVANSYLFQLTDAGAIPSSATATAGWVTVSSAQVKAQAKFVSDGLPSTNQFIEVQVIGTILSTALDACVKASIDDGDFTIAGTGAQTFSALGTYTLCSAVTDAGKDTGVLADIKPNGFLSVALDDLLNAGDDETLTQIKNGKITFEPLVDMDSLERPDVYGFNVMVEYDSTISDSASLLLLNNINPLNTTMIVTMLDGKTFSFSRELGFSCSFENIGDFDKLRVMKFTHTGRILVSEFNGIVS